MMDVYFIILTSEKHEPGIPTLSEHYPFVDVRAVRKAYGTRLAKLIINTAARQASAPSLIRNGIMPFHASE